MATDEYTLNLREKELVAVGASVGAGCHPCVDHHLEAGATAGLDAGQLLAAVTSAERVAAEAAVLMGDHVRERLTPSSADLVLLSRLEEALASLGAALGANDATNIERRLQAALDLGATRAQLEQAIETAKAVQENAARIHLRKAARVLDALAEQRATPANEAASGNGCGADVAPTAPAQDSAADQPATAGGAAATAGCCGGFEGACNPPATPAETAHSSAATAATRSCAKEV